MESEDHELLALDSKTDEVVAGGISVEHDDWLQEKGFIIDDQLKTSKNPGEKHTPLDEYALGDVFHELFICAAEYYKEPEFDDFQNFLQYSLEYCKQNRTTVAFVWNDGSERSGDQSPDLVTGCDHCGDLFDGFKPLGFKLSLDESDLDGKLGKDAGVYIIEIKRVDRTIMRDHTFIGSVLGTHVPEYMIKSILQRDIDPLINYQRDPSCRVAYIGKTSARGLADRIGNLVQGPHTNLISTWTMIEHGWELEIWYRKDWKLPVDVEEKRLLSTYKNLHSGKLPLLNRKG